MIPLISDPNSDLTTVPTPPVKSIPPITAAAIQGIAYVSPLPRRFLYTIFKMQFVKYFYLC